MPDMKLEDACKKVARKVTQNGRTKWEPVSPDEVLSFKDHGTHVVVVTIDGQKLSSKDKANDKPSNADNKE